MNEETFAGAGRAVGCVGIGVGLLVTTVGLALAGFQAYDLSVMEETFGVVIKYERGVKGMRGSGPHVRYTVDGEDYVTTAKSYGDSSFSSGVGVGDKVLIHYRNNDPWQAKVGLVHELWFASIFVTCVGMLFIAIASILAWTQKMSHDDSDQ